MSNWGGKRQHYRDRKAMELTRLNADISIKNWQRLRELAKARGESMAACVDAMIGHIWEKQERRREKQV